MSELLCMQAVQKSYGANFTVDIDAFVVEHGEICGLIGENGAGKTTLMRLALGLVKPDAGTIQMNWNEGDGRVSCLIEGALLDGEMTVEQNLTACRYMFGLDKTEYWQVVEALDLAGYLKKKCKRLSLGMKQKAALALAMMGRPAMVFLDEPVIGLDPSGVRQVREMVLHWNAKFGTTFLISSHNFDELTRVMTSCAIMRRGQVKQLRELDETQQAQPLEDLFFALVKEETVWQ